MEFLHREEDKHWSYTMNDNKNYINFVHDSNDTKIKVMIIKVLYHKMDPWFFFW